MVTPVNKWVTERISEGQTGSSISLLKRIIYAWRSCNCIYRATGPFNFLSTSYLICSFIRTHHWGPPAALARFPPFSFHYQGCPWSRWRDPQQFRDHLAKYRRVSIHKSLSRWHELIWWVLVHSDAFLSYQSKKFLPRIREIQLFLFLPSFGLAMLLDCAILLFLCVNNPHF